MALSDPLRSSPDVVARTRVRTCIGCRQREDRHVLVRVVAVHSPPGSSDPTRVEPDPAARRPGRGAWLHPTSTCLDTAVRRRAFARALRLDRPLDTSAIETAIATQVKVSTT